MHVLTDPKEPAKWVIRIFNTGEESITNHPQIQLNVVGPIKTKTAYVEWTGVAKTNENTDKLISGLERINPLSIDSAAKALYQDLK
jgi:hypothetical protein